MQIKSKNSNKDGSITEIIYNDAESFDSLKLKKVTQVYGVCFLNGKMVIVFNAKRKAWGLVGGSLEEQETYEECLKREVIEETNMRVLNFYPVGYQEVSIPQKELIYQLRYVCSVEAIGPFIADPAGAITEVKLIDPKTYKEYFDWGEIGDHIIQRAFERQYNLS